MRESRHGFERRDFLKSGLIAAAGTAALGQRLATAAAPAEKSIELTEAKLPSRKFGKTGHTLPILGMGGSAMVRLFTSAYGVELLPVDDRVAMVRHAYDSGLRYFDTARVYGESESIMGRGLKGVRDNVYLATKCHMTDPGQVRKCVETSLEQLGTDYVDCVQIHSPPIERVGFEGGMKIHAELAKLRDEKMLRFIGLTTHVAFEDVLKMIGTAGFDQVLLAYGYFRRGMDTILSNPKVEYRDMCLAKAADLGMAIVAMKVMGANIFSHNSKNLVADSDPAVLDKLPAAAIRWVLQDPRISMLNIGVSMPSDIDQNLATLTGNLAYTNDDRTLLAEFSAKAYASETVQKMKVT
ncbi:MAG TPA: aldo/keto reductase [Pirellulales bacterium]|jgi:predicted aldo/keto reductase-like oxidoreductase